MNILTDIEYKSRPPRIGEDRTIDDFTLWKWLGLAQTNKSLFDNGMIDYWSDMSEYNLREIGSLPTFACDIMSFCTELVIFLETHDTNNFSHNVRKLISYALYYYNKHSPPQIKDPGIE